MTCRRFCVLMMTLGILGSGVARAQPQGSQPLVQPEPGVEVVPVTSTAPLQREDHEASATASLAPYFDNAGMVLNSNVGQLPADCDAIGAEYAFTVHAGAQHAQPDSGEVFGFDQREWIAAPCSRVTVTLVNDDEVRHQWVLRGLPPAVYPEGVFHLEANGGQRVTGTFIVPGVGAHYPVSCDGAGHAVQGMQGQLIVASPTPGLPRGALVLLLAMALTSGSLLLTLPGRKE